MNSENRYDGVFQNETVAMMRAMMCALGFHSNDVEDAEQEVALELLLFKRKKPCLDEQRDKALFRKVILRTLLHYRRYLAYRATKGNYEEAVYALIREADGIPYEVRDEVERLPKRLRAVFALRWSGYTVREVARLLGCNKDTVLKGLSRLQEIFRKR